MKWTILRWPIRARDVLDAIGAWEDSHGTGHSHNDRATAKEYATKVLAAYVVQQSVLVFTGWYLLAAFIIWLTR